MACVGMAIVLFPTPSVYRSLRLIMTHKRRIKRILILGTGLLGVQSWESNGKLYSSPDSSRTRLLENRATRRGRERSKNTWFYKRFAYHSSCISIQRLEGEP